MLIKPLAASVYETIYKTVLERLGITSPTPEERVAALLAVPVEDILKKLPFNLPLRPMLDGELITRASTFTDVRSSKNEPGWCKSILIGHNQLDVRLLPFLLTKKSSYFLFRPVSLQVFLIMRKADWSTVS